MSVYVDDMRAKFRTMIMCHMIADTHNELIHMARAIGLATKWIQHAGTTDEHFDISLAKRALAIKHGAIPITWRQCAAMTKRMQVEGKLGKPREAETWLTNYYRERDKQGQRKYEVWTRRKDETTKGLSDEQRRAWLAKNSIQRSTIKVKGKR